MKLFKSFKIVIGVLLILSSITLFTLIFLEPEALAVMFDFSLDITASNLGEAIAGAVAGLVAGLIFLIAMFILGIFNFIVYLVVGILTLALKKHKVIMIIVLTLSSFALFLEIRALIFLSLGGFPSTILLIRSISDAIIVSFSIYNIFYIFRKVE
ncbi:MAG: hypothetical protein ACTSP9_05400 [Promethearchaeota archaeon]